MEVDFGNVCISVSQRRPTDVAPVSNESVTNSSCRTDVTLLGSSMMRNVLRESSDQTCRKRERPPPTSVLPSLKQNTIVNTLHTVFQHE